MARKGNQQKNRVDHHASNHKKRNSNAGCTIPDKKELGKTNEFKVLPGEQFSEINQPSSPGAGSASRTNHDGAECKSKQKSRRSFRKEKQEIDGMQGSEYPTSMQSNSHGCNGNIEHPVVSEENMSQSKENDSELWNDPGQMHRKSGLGFSFMHFQNVLGNIELPDNVVIRNLKASTLSVLKAVKEWLEKQRPSYDSLRAHMQNSCDFVQTKIKWAYPIVLKWLMQFGSILLILSLVWLDCTLRGIDSLVRMGTTSFFSVIWFSIISIVAMVGLLKFFVVLATAALVGVFLGLTVAVLLVAFSGAVFLWLYGSFWTTLLVIFLGGFAFALSQERIALLITSVYSVYCAWTYVGWLGLFFGLNLSFISTDILIYFLKNNMDHHHRRPNGSPQEPPGMQGQQGFVNSDQASASNPETGAGFSMDRGPGIPSTSGDDSDVTSEDEVVRLLNCTDHYSALGFARFEDVDVSILKREYRKKAMLVHPDKNMGNEKAAEAFKKLQNAYEVLLDSIKRKTYDDELRREDLLNIFRRFQSTSKNSTRHNSFSSGPAHSDADFEDLFGDSRRIACKKCGNFHPWILTRKPKSRARWCQDCNDLHQAKDGDGWVEQSSQPVFFGLLQKVDAPCAYVCADSKIYNATEWYICQGMRCPANTHKPSFHVNTSVTSKHNAGKGSSSGQRGSQMPASSNMEENMSEEEFHEWLQNAMQSGMFENMSGGGTAENPYAKPGNNSKSGSNNSGSGNKKKKKGKKQW